MAESLYELAEAVVQGRKFAFVKGEYRWIRVAGFPLFEWWLPTMLQDIDARRWRLAPVYSEDPGRPGKQTLSTRWELWSVERAAWENVENPEWFIKHCYQDEEGRLGYGRGLAEAIYFYWWAKGHTLQEVLQAIEKWAQGITIAKIDGLVPGSAGRTNDAQRQQYLDVLKEMKSRHVLAIDKRDDVEIKETSGTGHEMGLQWVKYFDESMTRLITGSVRPSGGGQGGTYGQGKVEQDTTESLIQFDRVLLGDTLTRDLVGLLMRMNAEPLARFGLGEARSPRWTIPQERREDPVQSAQVITSVLPHGIKLRSDEVYRKLGFTQPRPGDKVIEGRAPIVGPGFGPGLQVPGKGNGSEPQRKDDHAPADSAPNSV